MAREFCRPFRFWASNSSYRDRAAEAKGLTTATITTPIKNAITTTGRRNCHAETPAARVTTSSWLRVSRQKAAMPPNSTAKGTACCPMCGNFKAAISTMAPKDTPGMDAVRRISSMMSSNRISIRNTIKMVAKLTRKCRLMYRDRVGESRTVLP